MGYFTSSALALAAQGLPTFLANGGRMRLVASPKLTEDDVQAMLEGYERRTAVLEQVLLRELGETELPDPARDALACLSWLIAHDRLEVRIALLADGAATGVYHEKLGIFGDPEGERVAFFGSANESAGGLVNNFESILAFSTFRPEGLALVEQLEADFEQLWSRRVAGLEVIDLPQAARRRLLELYAPDRAERLIAREDSRRQRPGPPPQLQVRDYQREALAAWFGQQARGILEMATGTGKTITALTGQSRLITAMAEQGQPLCTVIVCPYQHLVLQWARTAHSFGLQPVLAFRSRERWEEELRTSLLELRMGTRPHLTVIATNATLATEAFQNTLAQVPEGSLLIADEMHNLGAPALRRALPEHVRYRLGLSATPERWRDAEGTAALEAYFGPVVFRLGLREAIELGALTRYVYHPVLIELDDEELERYHELSERIARRTAMAGDDPDYDEALKRLLIERARLLATARGKLPALTRLMQPLLPSTHNLFYCGDGQVETVDGDSERQVAAVVRALGQGLGMAVNRYTADVQIDRRDDLRERFAEGQIDGLVAIRCLDEGVDIPETRRAFILASSTNPRQFIQRRGRVLRRSSGKERAEIYDFIVVPPASADAQVNATERGLLARELARVIEFAALAENGPEALSRLRSLRTRFNLLHMGV